MEFKKRSSRILLMLSLAASYSTGLAWEQKTWVATLSIGPVWENAGETQTFYLAPDLEKTYKADDASHALADGELFFGIQQELCETLKGQWGLAVAATSSADLSGNIWDDADSAFDNYSYRYKVQHTHLAVKGKLLMDREGWWGMPWMSASLGVGFNHAYGFSNTPLISEAVAMPNFSSHTETSFTYTLSAGIQKALTQHWELGVAYEFADWGQSQLGRASGQTLNSGLNLDHLYTNGILFNVTYLL